MDISLSRFVSEVENLDYCRNVLEVVLEDQIVYADSTEVVASEENPFKKLLKKEQRLLERLQDEQEAEAEAQDSYQRAKARLQGRRKRVERFQRKLSLVREELAELQISDQRMVYKEHEVILVPFTEEASQIASQEDSLAQPEQHSLISQELADLSPVNTEYPASNTSEPEQEYASTHLDVNDVPANDGNEETAGGEEVSLPQQETTTPPLFKYEPIQSLVEPEFEAIPEGRSDLEQVARHEIASPVPLPSEPFEASLEPEVSPSFEVYTGSSNIISSEQEAVEEIETSSSSFIESTIPYAQDQEPVATSGASEVEDEAGASESAGASPETNSERRPTRPLQLEQPGSPDTVSHEALVQPAKEAWIAAETAMQHARNTVNGIKKSITFLSQTDGLSNVFMEELVRKQAEANEQLLRAQNAARAAYERFVEAQRDSQSAASQSADVSTGSSESSSRQDQQEASLVQQEASLPPAEENGLDQTAKLHSVRLYTEW